MLLINGLLNPYHWCVSESHCVTCWRSCTFKRPEFVYQRSQGISCSDFPAFWGMRVWFSWLHAHRKPHRHMCACICVCVCVCVCVCARTHRCSYAMVPLEVNGQSLGVSSLLPPCGIQGSKSNKSSGLQAAGWSLLSILAWHKLSILVYELGP